MGNASSSVAPVFPESAPLKKNPFNIGKYQCISKLGKGAFGVVYKATHIERPGEVYALKLQRVARQSQIEDVIREIQQHQSLNHPYIVKFQEASQGERIQYGAATKVISMVLEFIDGASLEKLFELTRESENMFEEAIRVKWAYQMIQGVCYIHFLGKIHRDLKPANMLISKYDLNLKIADFGLSRDLDEDGQASTMCGTPMYMPPEIQPGRYSAIYSSEVDIWALGIILLELLLGIHLDREMNKLIFTPTWEFELTKRIDLSKAPRSIWDAILECLRLNPQERITAAKLANKPIVKIYALIFGLLPKEQAGEIFREMVSSAESVVTILATIEGVLDNKIRHWVLEEFCANIDVIPLEGLINPTSSKVINKLVLERVASATKFQNLVKIKKRRSREALPQPTTVKYPETKTQKYGWYWKALPFTDGLPVLKKFFPIEERCSKILENFYLDGLQECTIILKTQLPPSTLAVSSDDSSAEGEVKFFSFDVERMSAKDTSTEHNFQLKRYEPKRAKIVAPDGEEPLRIFQYKYVYLGESSAEPAEQWIVFTESQQRILRWVYLHKEIISVKLRNQGRAFMLVDLNKMICMELAKKVATPVRYMIEN